MKLSRFTVGASAALLGALAIGSSSAWARPVAQAFTGPEAAFAPASVPGPSAAPPTQLPKPTLLAAAAADPSVPETDASKNLPAPPTLPSKPHSGRKSLRAAALDLRDPWGEGSLAVVPAPVKSSPSLDLVDPWDPSHSFAAPVSTPSMPLLDPWSPGH